MEKPYSPPPVTEGTESDENDHLQPVAYDAEGRPLYSAPIAPKTLDPQQHQVVHVARSMTPIEQEISPEVKARHEESLRRFPGLNLSENEYVINAVRRHLIGLIIPISMTVIMISLVAAMIISYPMVIASVTGVFDPATMLPVVWIGVLCILLFAIGGYIAVWVYLNNTFFLTNESVIQEIQTSIFSKHEQTVSLGNIEDASFSQRGILQTLFNYGSIRLSTEGDETTYRFDYVANPKQHIAILNNAVEAFKNGRPVEG